MAGASGRSGQREQDPFSLAWLNSCYHQTLFPDAPWHKLEVRVAKALAGHVEKQFGNAQRREMLLELLGRHYVDTYLSHIKRNPQELASLSGEEYERLKVEASSWLNNQMYRAIKDVGLEMMLSGAAAREEMAIPKDYQDFLQHTHVVVSNGIDRQLYKQEQVLKEEKEKELLNPQKAHNAEFFKVPAPSRMKPISTSGTSSSVSSFPKPTSGQMRAMIHTLEGDPPPLWGHQSESIGTAVVALLQRDPKKFGQVVDSLHGRQLPASLRIYIWADVLFKAERRRMKEVYSEKVVRERFARAVTRGLTELKIRKPTHSPIKGLIDNAVVETYTKTVSMVPYKHPQHLKEAAKALNVLYVYDRSYESYLVYWLFPLQLAFRDKDQHANDQGEHVVELAMYLDLLNAGCFPTWPEVFAIAECVMQRLQQDDPEFHNHLKTIATINVQGSPKEFLVQLIHREREQAEALLQAVPNSSRSTDQSSHQLLADPLIFLRRWIGEGFVSVLDAPAVMYVWDQCFMQCWQQSVLQNVCLALLELLRHRFMEARNHLQMKEVFLNDVCKLYTVDIQMAWIHVETGKHIADIPSLNRQNPKAPGSRLSMTQSHITTPTPGLLQEFGIKHLQGKLIIPAELVQREAWLTLLDPSGLRLHCSIYFGTIQLQTNISSTSPILLSADKDSYGNMVYVVQFSKEKFVYPVFDIAQYDVERELGASMYAVISMDYTLPSTSKSKEVNLEMLGWSRLPLFCQVSTSKGQETFTLIEGETQVALHPGEIPQSLGAGQPASPTQPTEGVFLGYNSELGALVFDPRREPVTPPVLLVPQPQPSAQQTPRMPPAVPPADTQKRRTPVQPKSTPAPAQSPHTNTPAPPPPEQPDRDPWVAFNLKSKNPNPTTSRDPFDFYVDSVRFIPDNASIIKVTGRILKGGEVSGLQDILALPLLQGPARCPVFDFRLSVNSEGKQASPEMLMLLRVYTVDMVTEKVVVIGSCLLKLFDTSKKKEGLLRVGGHQLRLRSGMPDVRQGIDNLKHTDLDFAPAIPACTLLVRLLPHSQDSVPAPSYGSGYYQSSDCQPTLSEKRIFASYADHMAYPQTEHDMVLRLQTVENKMTGTGSNPAILRWLEERLDIKKQLPANKAADNLNLIQCIRYRIKTGLKVKVNKAFHVPDGKYIVCVAQVAPGAQAWRMSPSEDNFGHSDPIHFTRLKLSGLLQAPEWEDDPQTLHPFYDDNSVFLVRLLGMSVAYAPTADHKTAGTLTSTSGQPLEVKKEHVLGWTVVPIFEGLAVQSGTHHVPIFTGDIPGDILEELRVTSPKDVFTGRSWSKGTKYEAASLTVTLWDAHYEYSELPAVPMYTTLEEAVGDAQAVQAAREASGITGGLKVQDIMLEALPAKDKKQGVKGSTFLKEQELFKKVASQTMQSLAERAVTDGVIRQYSFRSNSVKAGF